MDNIKAALESLVSGNQSDFQDKITDELNGRIQARIDDLKQSFAKSMFNPPEEEMEVEEEIEEDENAQDIQELSKKTLGSYVKKASNDMKHSYADSGKPEMVRSGPGDSGPLTRARSKTSKQLFKQSERRRKGISMAVDRLTK